MEADIDIPEPTLNHIINASTLKWYSCACVNSLVGSLWEEKEVLERQPLRVLLRIAYDILNKIRLSLSRQVCKPYVNEDGESISAFELSES